MNPKLVLLLEKSIEEQSRFIGALKNLDSSVTCIASSKYSEMLYRQRWNAIFVSVDDFIEEGISFIERFVHNKPLVVALADTTINKQACAEMGMDYFLIKPDNLLGWVDVLKPIFSAVKELQDVLVPLV